MDVFLGVYGGGEKAYFVQQAFPYITFDSAPKSHKESHRSTKKAEGEVWTYRIPVVVQVPNLDRTSPDLGR